MTALVLAVTTSAALNPGVTGQATATPLPAPPAVGSCLLLTADRSDAVPCDRDHHAEVVQTWPAGTLPPGIATFAAVAAYPFGSGGRVGTASCQDAQRSWVHGPEVPGSPWWSASSPVVDSQLLAAPPSQRTPSQGWVACIVVAPDRQLLAGSLRAGTATPPASRLGSCVEAATNAWGPVTLTCDQPHHTEILGSFRIRSVFDDQGRFTGFADDAALASSCAALAAALTRTDDPTFAGRLEVRAVSLFPASIWEVDAIDPAGDPVHTYIPLPQCVVELVGGGTLTGSVVGLGHAPLPLG
ncbi:MAG: hypothetical protein ABJA16_04345 [Nakamurella sp.]